MVQLTLWDELNHLKCMIYQVKSTQAHLHNRKLLFCNTSNLKYKCEQTAVALNLIRLRLDCNNQLAVFVVYIKLLLRGQVLQPYRYDSIELQICHRHDLSDWSCLQNWSFDMKVPPKNSFKEGILILNLRRIGPWNQNVSYSWHDWLNMHLYMYTFFGSI